MYSLCLKYSSDYAVKWELVSRNANSIELSTTSRKQLYSVVPSVPQSSSGTRILLTDLSGFIFFDTILGYYVLGVFNNRNNKDNVNSKAMSWMRKPAVSYTNIMLKKLGFSIIGGLY